MSLKTVLKQTNHSQVQMSKRLLVDNNLVKSRLMRDASEKGMSPSEIKNKRVREYLQRREVQGKRIKLYCGVIFVFSKNSNLCITCYKLPQSIVDNETNAKKYLLEKEFVLTSQNESKMTFDKELRREGYAIKIHLVLNSDYSLKNISLLSIGYANTCSKQILNLMQFALSESRGVAKKLEEIKQLKEVGIYEEINRL